MHAASENELWDMMGPAARAKNTQLDPSQRAAKAVEVVPAPGKRARREALWQAEIEAEAGRQGWLHYHTHRSDRSPAGFPDLVLIHTGQLIQAGRPRLFFAELKTDERTSKPSAEQIKWLNALRIVTSDVYLWRPQHHADVWRILAGTTLPHEDTRWPYPEAGE